MTQEDMGRWKTIIECVFAAERAIVDQWRDKLRYAVEKGGDELERMKDQYITAIAVEILNKNDHDRRREESEEQEKVS